MRVQLKSTVRPGHFARTLRRAMREHRSLVIVYTRANGSETTRTVEPYALTRGGDGAPYFRSMDRQSGEVRTWRFDRIKAYALGDEDRLEVPEPKSDEARLMVARVDAYEAEARSEWAYQRRLEFEQHVLASLPPVEREVFAGELS